MSNKSMDARRGSDVHKTKCGVCRARVISIVMFLTIHHIMTKNKLRYFLVLFFLQVFLLAISSAKVSAKTDLTVEGNVLGYELYSLRPISNITFPVLLKVTNVVDGAEKSEYIVVLMLNLYKEYAEENFGLDKVAKFKLRRQSFCDRKIKYLFRAGSIIEDGKIVQTPQTFTLISGVEKNSLPLKEKVPCYIESLEE